MDAMLPHQATPNNILRGVSLPVYLWTCTDKLRPNEAGSFPYGRLMSLTQRRIVELVQVGHAQRDCVIIQRSFLAKYESTWRSTRTRAVCLGAIFEATF